MTKFRKFLLAGGIALAVAVPTGVAVAETGGPDGSGGPQMGQHEGNHQMGDHQMGDHQMGDHQMGNHQMGDHQMGDHKQMTGDQAGHDGTCPHADGTDTSA